MRYNLEQIPYYVLNAMPGRPTEILPCRTCGFTHPEIDCPRWPANEDDDEIQP